MRLRVALLLALLVATAAAGPVTAAGNAFKFSAAGKGAEAFWSTIPDTGPVQNVAYTDTFIVVADQKVTVDGSTFTDAYLFFDQFTYKFDRNWNFVPLSDTFGSAGLPDVSISVDKNLLSATASATASSVTCTFGRRGTCTDGPSVAISASWTGTGDIIRTGGNFRANSKSFTYTSHDKGSFRDATASASIGGLSTGTLFFARIFNVSYHEVSVCHGC